MNINGHTFSSPDYFSKNFKFKKPATMNFLNLKINYCKRLDKNKNNEQYIHLSISQTNKCYLGLGWVIVFVNTISVISWRQFYWWRKPEYAEKTTDLSPVTDKLYHIMFYQHTLTEQDSNSQR